LIGLNKNLQVSHVKLPCLLMKKGNFETQYCTNQIMRTRIQ
jgi:hypothetical protein